MTKRHLLPVVLASLSLTLTACTGGSIPTTSSGSTDTVRIGFLAPLTGADASVGEGTNNGTRLAIDHINAAGGVNGKKLSLVSQDDQGEATKGVEVAKKLVEQNVVAIIGPTWSGVTKAVVTGVTKAAGIPNVSPGATSPELASFDDGGFFFRTIPNDTLQGKAMSRLMQEDGHKKVAILCRGNSYGNGFADAFVADFNATAGNNATKVEYPDTDKQDYRTIKAKIPAGVTAVTLVGYVGDSSSIYRDWIAANENVAWRWYFSESLRDTAFSTNVANPPRIEGMKGTLPLAAGTYIADFKVAYKARFNKEPGIYDAYAYDATMLVGLALARGKANTAAAVKDNIIAVSHVGQKQTGFGQAGFTDALAKLAASGNVDYDGVSGSVDMDTRGEMTGGNYVIWNWIAGQPVDTAKIYKF
ncbi:MAG: ABC transporter substrate-binding protein [Candidatus Sericytochromatia bacterium]|nr:ABC transporter substrate-binding protein [Candidatus Sericytochromatia bacterium]